MTFQNLWNAALMWTVENMLLASWVYANVISTGLVPIAPNQSAIFPARSMDNVSTALVYVRLGGMEGCVVLVSIGNF